MNLSNGLDLCNNIYITFYHNKWKEREKLIPRADNMELFYFTCIPFPIILKEASLSLSKTFSFYINKPMDPLVKWLVSEPRSDQPWLCCLPTTNSLTSLRIRAVWTAPSLFTVTEGEQQTCYMQNINIIASLCSSAAWIRLPQRQVFSRHDLYDERNIQSWLAGELFCPLEGIQSCERAFTFISSP